MGDQYDFTTILGSVLAQEPGFPIARAFRGPGPRTHRPPRDCPREVLQPRPGKQPDFVGRAITFWRSTVR